MNRIARAQWVVMVLILTLVGTVSALAVGVPRVDVVTITSGPTGNPNPVGSSGNVALSVGATDSQTLVLAYQWTAQDTAGHAAGSFGLFPNGATAQNPIWTAPANDNGLQQAYAIRVVVTSSSGQTAATSYWQRVWPLPDSVSITAGPAADPNPVGSGQTVQLHATATDTRGYSMTYGWTAKDDSGSPVGSFDDATKQNPIWTAPANPTNIVHVYSIAVNAKSSHGKGAGDFFREKVLPASQTSEVTASASGSPAPVLSGGTVSCTVVATDTLGHTLTYLWTATSPTGEALGSFNNATLVDPVWTAPVNNTGVIKVCSINVTITPSAGNKLNVGFRENIKPVPTGSEYVEITDGPSGDPNPVASAGQVQLSVTATDSLNHPLTYAWTAWNTANQTAGPAGAFDDDTAQNPTWTAPVNTSVWTESYSIKVVVTSSTGATAFTSYTQKVDPKGVDLGSAGAFAVLAGSTVTNTALLTTINGDLGVWPGSSVTGFPPGVVNGTMYVDDTTAEQAKSDLTTAYLYAAGLSTAPIGKAGNLGGQTLYPGLYKSTSSLAISSGNLTLDAEGDPNAVFVFQMASTLTVTSGLQVILAGGANPANIYWQVGSSATLGTTSVFQGNILAAISITMDTHATLNGRALTQTGAVTLDGCTVTRP